MPTRDEFDALVMNAYQSLYDFVRLRGDPLAVLLVREATLSPKEKGLRLHRILLDAIDELKPETETQPYSKPWRRHRLMMLRYSDALAPQAVADELAISLRQFYREHTEAMRAVTDTLWSLYRQYSSAHRGPRLAPGSSEPARDQLLEREAIRATHGGGYSELDQALPDVLALLHELTSRRSVTVMLPALDELPPIAVERGLLRQLLLAALGLMISPAHVLTLDVQLSRQADVVMLSLSHGSLALLADAGPEEQWAALYALASVGNVDIVQDAGGLTLVLPVVTPKTVLIIDDNEDALSLYERYLTANTYRPYSLSDPRQVVQTAREIQPYAVLLDLMMPHQDGWDVLQLLLTQPETCHIPVVVCSVLKQQELALSLGAKDFLEKPITERALIGALDALAPRSALH